MLTSRDVLNQSFTSTQFQSGYDEREVDVLLDRVVEALRYYERGGRPGPQAPATPTQDHRFTSTRLRRGYAPGEVDELLDRVMETLRYYEQGGRPDPQALLPPAGTDSEGLGQRAMRWLRGDPRR